MNLNERHLALFALWRQMGVPTFFSLIRYSRRCYITYQKKSARSIMSYGHLNVRLDTLADTFIGDFAHFLYIGMTFVLAYYELV